MNFVENLPLFCLFIIIGGIYVPVSTLVAGWLTVLTRFIYTMMAAKCDREYRLMGALCGNIPFTCVALATFF